jgi:hypothetical protein
MMERRASPPGRTGKSPVPTRAQNELLGCRFFVDDDLKVRGDVLMQLNRNNEFANGLERFV